MAIITAMGSGFSEFSGRSLPGPVDVRLAAAAGQPKLVFQPVVDLHDRRVVGLEALARFELAPPQPPDVWFRVAHDVGLGIELEHAVIRRALRTAASLPSDIWVAVNVSPSAVQAAAFERLLADGPAAQLVLEITEHAPIDDYTALRDSLDLARERGVRVAIDDVGAGFASLRHVLRLDPDMIKLDQEITRGVEHDAGRARLVGGLIAGASAVSTLVIAEGIETEPQLERLRELGARGGQGYLLGRPSELNVALSAADELLAALAPLVSTTRPAQPRRSLAGAQILCLDDSAADRYLIRTAFELEGAVVEEVATVAAALERLQRYTPDLVLLDARLPDGSGFDVLEHIRATSNVPVIFVTAATSVPDRIAGIDNGAEDYLLKPMNPDELVARADAVLRRRASGEPAGG